MSDLSRSPEHRDRTAEERGCKIVYPASNQIQIDIDNVTDAQWASDAIAQFVDVEIEQGRVPVMEMHPSPSGKPFHLHITITWPGHDRDFARQPLLRVAFQAVLGSDRKREFLSLIRIMEGQMNAVCFFEKKDEPLIVEPYLTTDF